MNPAQFSRIMLGGSVMSWFLAGACFAQPAPALITHPSPPPANLAFDAELRIWDSASTIGVFDPTPSVQGSTISFGYEIGCGNNLCDDPVYRSFPLHFPALAMGSYSVEFNNSDISPPTVARFILVVGGVTSAIPLLNEIGTITTALLLSLIAGLALRRRTPQGCGAYHIH